MPDARDEMVHVSVIRSGPTSARDEMTHVSVIRNKYPDARDEMMYVSVIIPLGGKAKRRGVIIADG